MAWRNVWRNYRRSVVTIAAMTLALMVELLYAGMVTGLVHGMTDDATAYELGEVQVFAEGYLTRPSIYETVDNHEAILDEPTIIRQKELLTEIISEDPSVEVPSPLIEADLKEKPNTEEKTHLPHLGTAPPKSEINKHAEEELEKIFALLTSQVPH